MIVKVERSLKPWTTAETENRAIVQEVKTGKTTGHGQSPSKGDLEDEGKKHGQRPSRGRVPEEVRSLRVDGGSDEIVERVTGPETRWRCSSTRDVGIRCPISELAEVEKQLCKRKCN